jgi:hypothetical protein
MTPGIPKKPAINAVTALMPIVSPKFPPTKFTISNNITPKTPFTNSLSNILRGHENNLTTRNNPTKANKK